MLIYIIIFFIVTITAFGMLQFRAWEIKTSRFEMPISKRDIFPKIYFRHIEKIMLYLAKHIIQWIVLIVIKYWFIIITKIKKWGLKNLPKIDKFFKKKVNDENIPKKYSFVRRAILESRMKIRHIKEKVRMEHED